MQEFNGRFIPHFHEMLLKKIGKTSREDVAAMIQKYPLMNAYWEDKRPRLHDINIPMYILASYSTGLHTEGSIRAWKYADSDQKWCVQDLLLKARAATDTDQAAHPPHPRVVRHLPAIRQRRPTAIP